MLEHESIGLNRLSICTHPSSLTSSHSWMTDTSARILPGSDCVTESHSFSSTASSKRTKQTLGMCFHTRQTHQPYTHEQKAKLKNKHLGFNLDLDKVSGVHSHVTSPPSTPKQDGTDYQKVGQLWVGDLVWAFSQCPQTFWIRPHPCVSSMRIWAFCF